ncbi:MAG TPA: TIGR00366 family protein, partial [Leptospiraceae bacterium]|nr:TIGR00366 family protein [Leptospiraceae bacterium]
MKNLSLKILEKFPDPFVFAVLMNAFLCILSFFYFGVSFQNIASAFRTGYFSLFSFSMQMALILLFGLTLAGSESFEKLLDRAAVHVSSPLTSVLAATLVSVVLSWLNWGFGLILGTVFAVRLAQKNRNTDFRLLVSCIYSGFIVWHGGLSGSIPLTVSTEGHSLQSKIGIIPLQNTVFSSFNLSLVLAVGAALSMANVFILSRIEFPLIAELPSEKKENPSSENGLLGSRIFSVLTAGAGTVLFISGFKSLDLNSVILILFLLCLLLHRSAESFLKKAQQSIHSVTGILVIFPLYGIIMSLLNITLSDGSTMSGKIAEMMSGIADQTTYPFLTFITAGILNLFIPSGGGQWAVQGPSAAEAAS